MKHLITVIALILVLSGAQGLIQPEKSEISISAKEVFSLPIKIKNESNEKKLIHLISKGPLKTEFRANDFYLNAGEQTEIALDIFPSFKSETYFIELRMEADEITEYSGLTVNTWFASEEIQLKYYRQNICRNRLDKISLFVKNTSSESKRIKLSAETNFFMANIEPNDIDLDAGEEKFVEIEILSNTSVPLNNYSIVVYAESNNTIVSKEVFFDLVECTEIKNEFRLSAPARISLRKNETKRVYFTVKNLEDKENEIQFAVRSNLITELQQTKTVLEPFESRQFWIDIQALKSNKTGIHKIELYAFNPFYEERKTFNAEVRGIHEIKSVLLNNNIEIQRGHSKIFTLLIENKGDFKEKIELNFFEQENINLHFSETRFYLNEKEAKKVYISVNPSITSKLKDYKIKIKVNGKELFLKFKAIKEEKPLQTEGIIEFLSAPERITLNQKQQKLEIVIKNISGEKIENTVFWIEGLPKGTAFESNIIKELETGKTRTAGGTLFLTEDAVKGTYKIFLVIEGNEFRQKKQVLLNVLEEPEEKETEKQEDSFFAGLAGLASLGTEQWIGLIIIVLIIIILLLNPGTQTKKGKKTWVNY